MGKLKIQAKAPTKTPAKITPVRNKKQAPRKRVGTPTKLNGTQASSVDGPARASTTSNSNAPIPAASASVAVNKQLGSATGLESDTALQRNRKSLSLKGYDTASDQRIAPLGTPPSSPVSFASASSPSSPPASQPSGQSANLTTAGASTQKAAPLQIQAAKSPAEKATLPPTGQAAREIPTPAADNGTGNNTSSSASTSEAASASTIAPTQASGFQAVVARVQQATSSLKAHEPAPTKAKQAQQAAVGPANEVASKAQARQVEIIEQEEPQPFNRAGFKAALIQKIDEISPRTLKEADEFKSTNKVSAVKAGLTEQVEQEREEAQGNIRHRTQEAPSTSGIEPKSSTPLPEAVPLQASSDIGAEQAIPAPKIASEVSLQADSLQLDEQMSRADITTEQLEQSNEPQFNQALEARQAAQANALQAPTVYRQEENALLLQARATAKDTAKTHLEEMHSRRADMALQVVGLQGAAKEQDEVKRAGVATDIQSIFDKTKKSVEDRLSQLDGEVNRAFEAGATAAQKTFEDHVDKLMSAYKRERYLSSVGGLALWVKDAVLGMPSEVDAFYQEGRELYIQQMDGVLDNIVTLVEIGLTDAKNKVSSGKKEIQSYIHGLPVSLQEVGQEAARSIQGKFDELAGSIDNKQGQLVESLSQKYTDSVRQMDDRIAVMKVESRGLAGKAGEAISGVVETINNLKTMLQNVLTGMTDVVGLIVRDPIGFLGNLLAGIKLGFMNFTGNIGNHLTKGLMEWLFGVVEGAGLQIPEAFDLKGMWSLILQVMGLTYTNIRARAVNLLGEKVVSRLEQAAEIFKILITHGPQGLWEHIKEKIGDLKALVLDQIKTFVIEQIIMSGVTWLLSLFNPVAAFIKACKAIYDVIMFFVDQGSRILQLVSAILSSVTQIAKGNIDAAANFIENALARGVPLVIGFLASLLNLSGLSEKIKSIIETVRKPVNLAIDWVIKKAVNLVSTTGNALGLGKEKSKAPAVSGKDHPALAQHAVDELKKTDKSDKKPGALRKEKEKQAQQIEADYTARLEPGIKLSIYFQDPAKDLEDHKIDFKVVIAPNTTTVAGAIPDNEIELEVVEYYFGSRIGNRLFSADEMVKETAMDRLSAEKNLQDWVSKRKLYALQPAHRKNTVVHSEEKVPLYSFSADKVEGQITGGKKKRSYYGYTQPAKKSEIGLKILSKGLMKLPPAGKLFNPDWHQKHGRYKSLRPGSTRTNLKYSDVILGHDDNHGGASGHWNRIGHIQTREENKTWNKQPYNYWGPEERSESAKSGNEAEYYGIPAKYFGSHGMWW
ncbi:MAG TPA: hypothetical protein VGB77_20375 [Abditibacteriaceae bacterium]|jgi:hypothetical protein